MSTDVLDTAIIGPAAPVLTASSPAAIVTMAHGAGGCSCGCGGSGKTCSCQSGDAPAEPPAFIFALGSIEVHFPDPALEQELADIAATLDITGQANSPGFIHGVLKTPQARYLVRQLCFLFTVEGQPVYALKLRDAADIELLIAAIEPHEDSDIDLLIGIRGPMAPREVCGGIEVPIAVVDRLTSFSRQDLIDRIPVPEGDEANAFRDTVGAVFDRLVQMTDNVGATDAHRALNFLAVRYAPLYAQVAAMEDRGFQLAAIDVGVSRLSGTRKILAPIFTFQNRNNGFVEKYFVRVDVTAEFPMIATHLQPYFDR